LFAAAPLASLPALESAPVMAEIVFGVMVVEPFAPCIMLIKAAVLGDGGGKVTPEPMSGVRPVPGVRPVRGVSPVRKLAGSKGRGF
jgi:hypothetical protein